MAAIVPAKSGSLLLPMLARAFASQTAKLTGVKGVSKVPFTQSTANQPKAYVSSGDDDTHAVDPAPKRPADGILRDFNNYRKPHNSFGH